jgi:hypothetical protein
MVSPVYVDHLFRHDMSMSRKTPVNLYRMGNSVSARMTNIREQDVVMFDRDGELWVQASSGGISTFAVMGRGKNWWRLDEGMDIPMGLRVVNDYGNHYLWEPGYTMRLVDYVTALEAIGGLFYKVN